MALRNANARTMFSDSLRGPPRGPRSSTRTAAPPISKAAASAASCPLPPPTREFLLETFQLDKALYEVAYELSYRPSTG